MKIDRMLETIIYLLNHENVSAHALAERFHVSVRTIQRDMISISEAGIPVYANAGKYGGYSILPTCQIKNAQIRDEEQQMIVKALKSLSTSYTNDTLQSVMEKYNAIIEREGGQKIFWDFGVTKENQQVQGMNMVLEKAIKGRNYIHFDYRNANGEKTHPRVEPLAIHYKWYAWYLFAYVPEKEGFRTFKVARIQNLVTEMSLYEKDYGDVEHLMKKSEQEYYKTCIHIEVHFQEDDRNLMEEYFPDCPIEKLDGSKCRIFVDVPAKERLWKALLLSLGNKVTVVAPESYRDELIETARKFLSNYDI